MITWVRSDREFEQIRRYIENNPVRAGLVQDACTYRWSSTGWQPGGRPADEASAPLNDDFCKDLVRSDLMR